MGQLSQLSQPSQSQTLQNRQRSMAGRYLSRLKLFKRNTSSTAGFWHQPGAVLQAICWSA